MGVIARLLNFSLLENFLSKIQNLEQEIFHFRGFQDKIDFLIIRHVFRPMLRICSCLLENCTFILLLIIVEILAL